MRSHLLLFLLCALLGVPIGASGVAYALSCAEAAVTARLEPVEVSVDGEPAELRSAPSDASFSRTQSGRGFVTTVSGEWISLAEESP